MTIMKFEEMMAFIKQLLLLTQQCLLRLHWYNKGAARQYKEQSVKNRARISAQALHVQYTYIYGSAINPYVQYILCLHLFLYSLKLDNIRNLMYAQRVSITYIFGYY